MYLAHGSLTLSLHVEAGCVPGLMNYMGHLFSMGLTSTNLFLE